MKILYTSNSDWNLYLFRLPIARRLREAGHDVVMAAPGGNYAERMESEGFQFETIRMSRSGMNPLAESVTLIDLARTIRRVQPDILHNFTGKGVLYGATAARLANAKRVVNSITGLGYVFASDDLSARVLRPAVKMWYRAVLRSSEVIFQNRDDLSHLAEAGIVDRSRSHLILSSGVDTDQFAFAPEPNGKPIVVFVGRMLWLKGVGEFVDAARRFNGSTRFVLVGDTDVGHPSAVPRETLQQWHDEGVIEWWGHRDDVPEVLASSHVYCMPTAGHEGVPRSLLEAASVGRPLVATDNRGCREIVVDGQNGMLVPVGDTDALRRAIGILVEDPALRKKMGRRAREVAVEKFSADRVARETLDVYERVMQR